MKKNTLLFALFLMPVFVLAQDDPIDALFAKYGGQDGFTTVIIRHDMFKLLSAVETEEGNEMELLKDITGIRILAQEDETVSDVNFFNELEKTFPFRNYEELMVVKESDQDVRFLVKYTGEKISHLVVIVGGKEDNALISIEGLIDLDKIAGLARHMDGPMEHLEELGDLDL